MKSDKINFNDLENSIKKIEELSDSIRMSLQGARQYYKRQYSNKHRNMGWSKCNSI